MGGAGPRGRPLRREGRGGRRVHDLETARDELGIERILAITHHDNVASVRVLGRLGLRFLRMIVLPGDDPEELSLFEGPLTVGSG